MSDRPTKDPAASAPLSELVAVNIAGDIEAVADEIRAKHAELVHQWVGDDLALPPMVHYLAAWNTRLRRIAAGVRKTQK